MPRGALALTERGTQVPAIGLVAAVVIGLLVQRLPQALIWTAVGWVVTTVAAVFFFGVHEDPADGIFVFSLLSLALLPISLLLAFVTWWLRGRIKRSNR